jgi:hypothetical protein
VFSSFGVNFMGELGVVENIILHFKLILVKYAFMASCLETGGPPCWRNVF